MSVVLTVVRSGLAQVQDLGRPGFAAIGVAANGAGDQRSARLANALVGNADAAALIEITASAFEFQVRGDALLAITGAAAQLAVDGYHWPAGQPVAIPSGATVHIAAPDAGTRSYLAINGFLQADKALGSVAPDPLLGFGRTLRMGDEVKVASDFHASDVLPMPVFRVPSALPRFGSHVTLTASKGPDFYRLAGGESVLSATFEMTPQSDYIGVRLVGGDLSLAVRDEILSRGVPVGAVEVPPSGELIMLMRGRLVTAGYPVVAVLTRGSIDRLAQARPGDQVSLHLIDRETAMREIETLEGSHLETSARVASAFRARGLERLLDARHASYV